MEPLILQLGPHLNGVLHESRAFMRKDLVPLGMRVAAYPQLSLPEFLPNFTQVLGIL